MSQEDLCPQWTRYSRGDDRQPRAQGARGPWQTQAGRGETKGQETERRGPQSWLSQGKKDKVDKDRNGHGRERQENVLKQTPA